MSDRSESEDVDSIREQKKERLKSEASGEDEPVHVEDESHFQELTGDGVVLVDFYADWCGPCQMLEPIVEDVAGETGATVAKVDVDRHQALAGQYGVQGVPMLLLFVDGEPVNKLVGVQDKGTLVQMVEQYT